MLWLCNICMADIILADQTNGLVFVCPCTRVLPGERAPEGESEVLSAAPVWSHSSW